MGTGHSIVWAENKMVFRNTISQNPTPDFTGKDINERENAFQ